MTEKIDKCPHCGSDYGFYRITYMKGRGCTNYNFPGKKLDPLCVDDQMDNSMLHDCLSYRENKTAFCIQCHKPIKELKKKEST